MEVEKSRYLPGLLSLSGKSADLSTELSQADSRKSNL